MQKLADVFSQLLRANQRDERRSSPRSSPSGLIDCHLVIPGEDTPLPGYVNDLSLSGVSIVSERVIPPSAHLTVSLFNASCTCVLTVRVELVRAQRLPSGQYLLGGKFLDEVTYEDLIPFLI
jgi:hypothetical protein